MSEPPPDPWQTPSGPFPPPQAPPTWGPPQDWTTTPSYGWAPTPPAPTNTLSVITLVTGCIALVPVAIVTGIIALVQIGRRQEKGRGLAIGGLCAAGFWALLLAAGLLFGFSGGFHGLSSGPFDSQAPLGRISDAGATSVGRCLLSPDESDNFSRAVDCAEEHDGEIYLVGDLGSSGWPGSSKIAQRADDQCYGAFESYVGKAYDDSDYDYGFFVPDDREWEGGEHRVLCVVLPGDNTPKTGSARNADR